ncbi:MAG: AraC family transcriptional regulator [Pseudomonadales bacterium]
MPTMTTASKSSPRLYGLHDFRMEDVSYEIATLAPGQAWFRPPGVAGYFYHVLSGSIEVSRPGPRTGRLSETAGARDTVVVGGYMAHSVRNPADREAKMLIGSEPYEHLAWLGATAAIACHRAASGHPLMRRLLLAMDLVIEEIANPETTPDQLTLERTAELIIFYFFRMQNPVTGTLDPFPWSDPRLMRAIASMNEHPSRRWTVDQLAEVASMSRSAFSARFKAVLGETPMRLLAAIRLKLAARRMLEGSSIPDAASVAGYGTEEAFTRAFKRLFGTTPGRWLRERRAS